MDLKLNRYQVVALRKAAEARLVVLGSQTSEASEMQRYALEEVLEELGGTSPPTAVDGDDNTESPQPGIMFLEDDEDEGEPEGK